MAESELINKILENNTQGALELIKKPDCNVNETYQGETALIWAVKQGYLDVTSLLLDAGADIIFPEAMKKI